MRVTQLNEGMWAMTYLVVCEESNSATLIDPVYDEIDNYLSVMESEGLKLTHCIATHTHADHITGCFTLREKTGCDYVMWEDTPSQSCSIHVDEESVVEMGSVVFQFHHVPGHTNDSMIVECSGHIFTGDFLFTGDGGAGRDDLPSGRVHHHWNSLDALEQFSNEMLVCTGHEPPGTEMQTMGWNRENNPVLKFDTFEEYANWQETVSAGLGAVSKIKTALPANLFAEVPEDIPWLNQ